MGHRVVCILCEKSYNPKESEGAQVFCNDCMCSLSTLTPEQHEKVVQRVLSSSLDFIES